MKKTTDGARCSRPWRSRGRGPATQARAPSRRRRPTPAAAAAQATTRSRSRPSRAWTSTASPCSTWATSPGQNDPNWFDVLRPTKLPAYENEFGEDGHFFAGVRQSRLGVKGFIPTDVGEIKTIFEFELFGTGVDAGQTTFRLRHAWGELGQFGAGQTWSPFMDPDVFPNSIEYWGPNGMVFFRNVQLRWTPWSGRRLALRDRARAAGRQRRPGRLRGPHRARRTSRAASRCPTSRRTSATRGDWGHVQVAGILRQMKWDDLNDDQFDLTRRRDRLGHQPQHEHQARRSTWSAARSSTARASRTT